MLSAKGVCKSFSHLRVLTDVSFDIRRYEFVSIVGPSGTGKTTLLQIISTLADADSGEMTILDKQTSRLSHEEVCRLRNTDLGFVFQFHQLLPEFTALENVMIPALIAGRDESEAHKEAMALLTRLGLSERSTHHPNELSGGEKQRVAVARALINKPQILFADEPTGSLDSQNRDELQKLFLDLRKEFGLTVIVVTHDMTLAQQSDRIIEMKDGRII
ncbi:MAG: ABC transporter ATP-binding protein [Paludibacteraceae bacterium]|nr:ABC transporter ATP-binding protein [Paludibacteraceae bacterium]